MRDDYLVKPVLKAMQVLDCICSSDQALSLQHVSVEVALPKTTVFRYLRTLVQSGLLSYDPERDVYGVGLKIITWGRSNARLRNLRDGCHLHPVKEVGATLFQMVLDGEDVLFVFGKGHTKVAVGTDSIIGRGNHATTKNQKGHHAV